MTAFLPPNLLALFAPRTPFPSFLPWTSSPTRRRIPIIMLVSFTYQYWCSGLGLLVTDQDPRIRTTGLRIRIRILLFASVAFSGFWWLSIKKQQVCYTFQRQKFLKKSLNSIIEIFFVFFWLMERSGSVQTIMNPDLEGQKTCGSSSVIVISAGDVTATPALCSRSRCSESVPKISVSVEILLVNYKLLLKFVNIFIIVGYRTTIPVRNQYHFELLFFLYIVRFYPIDIFFFCLARL
jgi:hypothetical protein